MIKNIWKTIDKLSITQEFYDNMIELINTDDVKILQNRKNTVSEDI